MVANCGYNKEYLRQLMPRFYLSHLFSSKAVKQERRESVYRMAEYLRQCRDLGALNLNRAVQELPPHKQDEMEALVKKASNKVFASRR